MGSSNAPIPNDQTKMQAEALVPLTQANALVIRTATDYAAAGELKVACRQLRQKAEAFFKPMKEAAYRAHKAITETEKKTLQPLAQADALIENKMLAWRKLEEERRRREQEAAEAEARRRAEEETLAAAAALAHEAEASGDALLMAAAEQMLDHVETAPVYVASAVPKVAGVSDRQQPTIEVTDKSALIMAVAAKLMLDVLQIAQNTDGSGWKGSDVFIVRDFLYLFQPVDGIHYIEIDEMALKRDYVSRGEAFSVAGVVGKHKDRII